MQRISLYLETGAAGTQLHPGELVLEHEFHRINSRRRIGQCQAERHIHESTRDQLVEFTGIEIQHAAIGTAHCNLDTRRRQQGVVRGVAHAPVDLHRIPGLVQRLVGGYARYRQLRRGNDGERRNRFRDQAALTVQQTPVHFIIAGKGRGGIPNRGQHHLCARRQILNRQRRQLHQIHRRPRRTDRHYHLTRGNSLCNIGDSRLDRHRLIGPVHLLVRDHAERQLVGRLDNRDVQIDAQLLAGEGIGKFHVRGARRRPYFVQLHVGQRQVELHRTPGAGHTQQFPDVFLAAVGARKRCGRRQRRIAQLDVGRQIHVQIDVDATEALKRLGQIGHDEAGRSQPGRQTVVDVGPGTICSLRIQQIPDSLAYLRVIRRGMRIVEREAHHGGNQRITRLVDGMSPTAVGTLPGTQQIVRKGNRHIDL